MSETVIQVKNLGKQYKLGEIGTGTLSHDLNRWMARVRGKGNSFDKLDDLGNSATVSQNLIWALENVEFDVKKGEVLGIIGRNGAGKSTLLKILSKITTPTTGSVSVKGRIASLLEVGTGFHQELTGRENIFLNGAILGMSKQEINRKLEEIIEFSGVQRFIDTPVKRYSSGMHVRLAFSVAAFLEPEIMIIDEVLAVGDADFQKKCLGRMKDINIKDGRTVLFVSHNMAAVKQLCTRGILLKSGKLEFDGDINQAVNRYQMSHQTNSYFEHTGPIDEAPGNENIRIIKFNVSPIKGDVISISSGIEFEMQFYNAKESINLDATFELRSIDEVPVLHHGCLLSEKKDSQIGFYTVKGRLNSDLLNAGIYYFNLIFGENQRHPLYTRNNFVQFEVMNEAIGTNANILPGVIRPNIPYSVSFNPLNNPNGEG